MFKLTITGFDCHDDPAIPNEIVKKFLISSFGEKALTMAKIWHIRKIPFIIIYTPTYLDKKTREDLNSFLFCTPLRIYARTNMPGMYFTDNLEDYLGLAKHLEGVDDINEIRHLYKVRAFAGNTAFTQQTEIGRFDTEQPENYDYLNNCGLSDQKDLMRAYILGTVAHEVAHRIRSTLSKGWDDDYRLIVRREINPSQRKKYVSDYVLLHQEVYNNDTKGIEEEDLVEAVRILLTNSQYLQKFFPQRYEFLIRTMPYITPNGVIKAIRLI